MQFRDRRQKFANEHRQRQREQILRLRRQQLLQQTPTRSLNIDTDGLMGLDLNDPELVRKLNNGQVEEMLIGYPQWIASIYLREAKKQVPLSRLTLAEEAALLDKLMLLIKYCITNRRLLLPITNCLLELTTLPIGYLSQAQIPPCHLADQFLPECLSIFSQHSDMPIIFNCVYIFGNLHQDVLLLSSAQQIGAEVERIEQVVLDRLEWICGTYPRYENALELLLWYMKSFLLVPAMGDKQPLLTPLQLKCAEILARTLLSLCSKLHSQPPSTTIQQYALVKEAFGLLGQIIDNPAHREQFVGKAINGGGYMHRVVYEIVEECFAGWMGACGGDSCKLGRELRVGVMEEVGRVMAEVLGYFEGLAQHLHMVPRCVSEFCRSVCSGAVKCPVGAQVCTTFLRLSQRSKLNSTPMVREFISSYEFIFKSEQILTDREYRVAIFNLFQQILDCTPTHTLLQVTPTLQPMQQRSRSLDTVHEYLLCSLLPAVLNILQLLLIDEQADNRSLGLRIVLKLSQNWEVPVQGLRRLVVRLGLHAAILRMQEEPQELVYSRALDLIEELGLDDQQW